MAEASARTRLLGLSLLVGTAFLPVAAHAAQTVTLSANATPLYEWVPLADAYADPAYPQYAAQDVMTINYGSTYDAATSFVIYAWCIDLVHNIGPTGNLDELGKGDSTAVYTLGTLTDDHSGNNTATSTPISAFVAQEILGLANYGDQQMAIDPTATMSAAVQAAIWSLEYNLHIDYSGFTGTIDPDLLPLFNDLLAMAPTLPAGHQTEADSFLSDGVTYNLQSLIMSVSVPEPPAFAVFGIGLAGLFLARRRAATR